MARPRKRKHRQLPKYVYLDKGRYFYKPYMGTVNGKSRFGKQVWLAPESAAIDEVWEAYVSCKKSLEPGTLEYLADIYFVSNYFEKLAPKTKELYRGYWKRISQTKTRVGAFGSTPLVAITPGVVRKYLDRRIREGAVVQSNRERGFLSVLFAYACERDMLVKNPVANTRTQAYVPRDRYVTDAEFESVFELATPYVQDAMEIAYLCRGRMSEVLSLRLDDIKEDGVLLRRTKGSKTQIISWSKRLRGVVNRARTRPAIVSSFWVIHNKRGQRIRKNTLQTAWQRLMRKALEIGAIQERYTFHDLKAKGVSDFEGDKHKASGHKTHRMTAIYDRKLERVDSTR